MTRISPAELANRTREIMDQVRRGEPTFIESSGNEPVVLLDGLDFRLLQALAAYAVDREGTSLEEKALRDYLNEEISLGKVADLLQVNWFVLTDSFRRLGIPLHLGPASLEEAREEIEAMRELLGRPASE
jgi:PHD/YefM family antitoxin component YafN of YafNO toxin-antitoxin module